MNEKACNRKLRLYANHLILSWHSAIEAGSFSEAGEAIIRGIRRTHQSHSDLAIASPEVMYRVRLALNALRDVANLELIMANSSWISYPKAVVAAWQLSHDANERLRCLGNIDSDTRSKCLNAIRRVWTSIQERYGEGLYNSCEFVFDSLVCTICKSDLRGCDHIPGRWYEDQLCQGRAEGIELVASSLVRNPRDPRCRIWPWQWDESLSVFHNILMYSAFEPDGEESGGNVVDVDKLFPSVLTALKHDNIMYDVFAYRELSRNEIAEVIRDVSSTVGHAIDQGARIRVRTIIGFDADS